MKYLELNHVMVICNHTIINHMIIEERERREKDVRAWKPEEDIKYTKPTFSKGQNVTCEKDIWTASDINIFDALTPLDQSILFLDGRVSKDTIRQPDFVVVNGNMLLLMAWECKPKWVL
ncbi:hypothetical protein RhiirA4_429689 [Rhizophagus irregularis]|uniref:Uncharacterized protein n=1 Tax=Rhizophagus irregularis TaxID=588596 RepID=A0A2I1HHU6_9GLOM|nr:hypothetical protein RhiirA4_429689 [Rhizophagus irregularis]